MTPWRIGGLARMSHSLRQEGVARERLGSRPFTSIDIRFPSIARGIDQEIRFGAPEKLHQQAIVRIINGVAGQSSEGLPTLPQSPGERLTNIAGRAKKQNHAGKGKICGSLKKGRAPSP